MSTVGLFGQTVVEPMPSRQMPLFHEPVAAPPVTVPGTTAADRIIARKFDERDTPTLPVTVATELTKEQREAVRLLGIYTGGRFDLIFALTGPAKRSCRVHILRSLLGEKHPAKDCGSFRVQREFVELARAHGVDMDHCLAVQNEHFRAWARTIGQPAD